MWQKLGRYRWPAVFFILGVFFTLLRMVTGIGTPESYHRVDDVAMMQDILAKDAVVLDLREEQAYLEGHIPSAVRIAPKAITTDKMAELTENDMSRPIVVVADKAGVSKKYAEKIARTGYEAVYDFGVTENWQQLLP